MTKIQKAAALYIATLRAMSLIHQHNHWTAAGSNFYELHLLFERLYKSSQELADQSAEKFIGTMGPEVLDYELQIDLIAKVMSRYDDLMNSPLELSLKIEKDFIKLSKQVYELLDQNNAMTLGTDDMIMANSSDREEAVYLLQSSMQKVN